MMAGDPVDAALRGLGQPSATASALPAELEAELEALEPVATRAPLRQLTLFAMISMAVAGGILALVHLRPELGQLPRLWLLTYCAGWVLAFVGVGALALVPARGAVTPRYRWAGIAASAVGTLFVLAGLLVPRNVPGLSVMTPETLGDFAANGQWCMEFGLLTAVTPVVFGALALRGAVPIGARWTAAGLGAAGGALGGLMLHLHCNIADRWHLGLIHGGVVIIGSLLASVAVARLLRP